MSKDMTFFYGGYHFVPVRCFEKHEGDFFVLTKRLEMDPELGLSAYKERQKYPYHHEDFYAASTHKNCDIFLCVENGRLYVPGTRELFIYHSPKENERFSVMASLKQAKATTEPKTAENKKNEPSL